MANSSPAVQSAQSDYEASSPRTQNTVPTSYRAYMMTSLPLGQYYFDVGSPHLKSVDGRLSMLLESFFNIPKGELRSDIATLSIDLPRLCGDKTNIEGGNNDRQHSRTMFCLQLDDPHVVDYTVLTFCKFLHDNSICCVPEKTWKLSIAYMWNTVESEKQDRCWERSSSWINKRQSQQQTGQVFTVNVSTVSKYALPFYCTVLN